MPQTLGRYEIGPRIGRGGNGSVYRATLVGPGGLRRPVAIKVLESEALRREARIGGLLRHRHLVDVYEVGEEGGHWFCAMELCDGGALTDHLPLPPRAVVEVGLAVCDALRYAHRELGLVHLDIKPDNLLLTADGTVKLADLGISRAAGFDDDGAIRGTPGYMAPEQRRGAPAGPPADLFALGITLVELARGAGARGADTVGIDDTAAWASGAETVDWTTTDDAPAPHESRSRVPGWLAPAVDRCLAWDPEDRWPDMAALASALRALEVDGPSLAEAVGLAVLPEARTHRELPAPGDAFVGRVEALRRLAEALTQPGLVTLKGPAGIGKSRLALEAALAWPGDALLCRASAATSRDGLLHAVGQTLDVPLPRGDVARRLGHALAARGKLVLVLDDLDPRAHAEEVLPTWVALAPQLRVLVTSRTPVGVDGERRIDVAPLDEAASVALLRARAFDRGVEADGDPDIPELARRLDGVPLALELAAGRLGVLSAQDVLDRLGRGILRSGVEGRHGTLQDALAWSWDLLDPILQSALGQLTAFRGGFTLEAAEGVLDTGGHAPVDAVAQLVDHSMVRAVGPRFDLLAPVRDFAEERAASPDANLRHGQWFAGFGEPDVVQDLRRHGGAIRRARRMPELDNLVAACRRAVARGDGGVAVRTLAGAWSLMAYVGPFPSALALARAVDGMPELDPTQRLEALWTLVPTLRLCGLAKEATTRCEEASHRVHSVADQSRLHSLWGRLLLDGGQPEEARRHLERALPLAEDADARHELGDIEGSLGILHSQWSEAEASMRHYRACLALREELGDTHGQAMVLANIAALFHRHSQPTRAREFYLRAMALHRELKARRSVAFVQTNLGVLERQRGNLEGALELLEQAAETFRAVGDLPSLGVVLGNVGLCHTDLGQVEDALAAYTRALEIHRAGQNTRSEGSVLGNLGLLYALQVRFEEARTCYRDALEAHRSARNRHGQCVVLGNLAHTWREEDPDQARSLLEQAVELAVAVGDKRFEALWRAQLSLLMSPASGLELLDQAEAVLADHEDPAMWCKVLASRAIVLARLGRTVEAREVLERARDIGPPADLDAARVLDEARAEIEG